MALVPTVGASVSSSLVTLCTALTGNVVSTNTADRGPGYGPALLTIVSTIGATPTVTVDIQGSVDNADWWSVGYATSVLPETPVIASLVITTATTGRYILRVNQPWRYLRLNLSANTNVTLTASLYVP